jgi:hypothetical protein
MISASTDAIASSYRGIAPRIGGTSSRRLLEILLYGRHLGRALEEPSAVGGRSSMRRMPWSQEFGSGS